MVEKIKMIKDQFLGRMEQELNQRGIQRVDVESMGKMADIVKDLAEAEKSCWEAEYYRTVTEAMEGKQDMAGYGGGMGRMGYNGGGMAQSGGGRRGYGTPTGTNMMGHGDPLAAVRDLLATSDAESRAQIRSELSNLMSM